MTARGPSSNAKLLRALACELETYLLTLQMSVFALPNQATRREAIVNTVLRTPSFNSYFWRSLWNHLPGNECNFSGETSFSFCLIRCCCIRYIILRSARRAEAHQPPPSSSTRTTTSTVAPHQGVGWRCVCAAINEPKSVEAFVTIS